MPNEDSGSTGHVVLGFFLGLLIGLLCFILSIVVGLGLNSVGAWIFPLVNGVAIVIAGVFALRKYSESGTARGVVIALSLVFMLNAICGITLR